MNQKIVREYTIDLSKEDPYERLEDFYRDGWATKQATKLAQRSVAKIENSAASKLASKIASMAFGMRSGDYYKDELDIWADQCELDKSYLYCSNLGYELARIYEYYDQSTGRWDKFKRVLNIATFCSSVSFPMTGKGMVHCRNMDWPLKGISAATIKKHYIGGEAGNFTAIGLPGMVGELSAVAKGRFSATINQAPFEIQNKWGGWSAPLLLRNMFETCESYSNALEYLFAATTVVPVFIQLTGIKKGESCVVEVLPRGENKYWEYDGEPLAITNHCLDDEDYSDDESGMDSGKRLEVISKQALKCKAKTLFGAGTVLSKDPVLSNHTQQSMVMCAKTGEVVLLDL